MKRVPTVRVTTGQIQGDAPAVVLRGRNCPTCGYVMCEQFDDTPINQHATLATPNGTFICYGCSNEKGIAVDCAVCGRLKGPRGRSVAPAMANSLCDWECPGYVQDPKPGDLWPGESRAEFGYPRVPPRWPPQGVTEGGGPKP